MLHGLQNSDETPVKRAFGNPIRRLAATASRYVIAAGRGLGYANERG